MNTKQVFAMLYVSWENKDGSKHEATLWDAILRTPETAHVQLSHQPIKYYLYDLDEDLKGKTLTLTLAWESLATVGPVWLWEAPQRSEYTLPTKRCKHGSRCEFAEVVKAESTAQGAFLQF